MKKTVEFLKMTTEDLLGLMSVGAKVDVSYDKKQDVFIVDIDSSEATGLLIGKRGETLSGLQTLLGFSVKQKFDEWKRVIVNVGDYREKEENYLRDLAKNSAERAKETGEPQNLYNLKPWQRRVVHLALAEESGISTESVGEGEERYLVIKPNK